MKIRIELDEQVQEDEVIIRCQALTEQIQAIQKAISDVDLLGSTLDVYKGDTQYYIPLKNILFFETVTGSVQVHTRTDIFQTKYKLYELEEQLPGFFMRISKSAICNTHQVYAINRNLTASSCIEFQNTHKQVYVSRNYYKPLIHKLEEKRLHHE